jgi:hypothetical protein
MEFVYRFLPPHLHRHRLRTLLLLILQIRHCYLGRLWLRHLPNIYILNRHRNHQLRRDRRPTDHMPIRHHGFLGRRHRWLYLQKLNLLLWCPEKLYRQLDHQLQL